MGKKTIENEDGSIQRSAPGLANFAPKTWSSNQIAKSKGTIAHKIHLVSELFRLNVGVAIPALNEEKNIEHVLCELKSLGYGNVLVIDGASKDGTLVVAEKNGAKVVLQDHLGKGQAIRQVLSNGYLDVEALVLMDADGSMSPEEVPSFIQALQNGADVVKGSRVIRGGGSDDMTTMRRVGNNILTTCANLLCSSKYTDLCYGFMAFNKKAIRTIAPVLTSNGFEIEAEIFIKAKRFGLKVVEIPSHEHRRRSGASNLNTFRDGFKILKTIINETVQSS
jgi:glycosyltransferase involved in cell wall biosynthesis